MHSSFNADFYVTAATVIPVLYLALTLQGTTFRELMEQVRQANDVGEPQPMWRVAAVLAIGTAAASVVLGSPWAEYLALSALRARAVASGTDGWIIASCVGLLIAVAVGPAKSFYDSFIAPMAGPFTSSESDDEGTGQPELQPGAGS